MAGMGIAVGSAADLTALAARIVAGSGSDARRFIMLLLMSGASVVSAVYFLIAAALGAGMR